MTTSGRSHGEHDGRAQRRALARAINYGHRRNGTKWVYDFAEGSREMRDLLGGKGANVAEMTRLLGQERVSSGFTSHT